MRASMRSGSRIGVDRAWLSGGSDAVPELGTGSEDLPIRLSAFGWPEPLEGMKIDYSESGVGLGLSTTPRVVAWLSREVAVIGAEIDPRLGVTRVRALPASALATQEAYQEWIWDEVPADRLLLYPPGGEWWIVEDGRWEVVIACGPLDLRVCLEPLDEDALLDWHAKDWVQGPWRPEALHVAELYGLPLGSGYTVPARNDSAQPVTSPRLGWRAVAVVVGCLVAGVCAWALLDFLRSG